MTRPAHLFFAKVLGGLGRFLGSQVTFGAPADTRQDGINSGCFGLMTGKTSAFCGLLLFV
jgi:hypothetical protein